MRLRFNIKHVLGFTAVFAVAIVLQMRLNHTISEFADEIANPQSDVHVTTIDSYVANSKFPRVVSNDGKPTAVQIVAIDSNPSVIDLMLFRRKVACSHTITIVELRREIAHTLVPKERRVDDYFVDVPIECNIDHVAYCSAGPFGFSQIDN